MSLFSVLAAWLALSAGLNTMQNRDSVPPKYPADLAQWVVSEPPTAGSPRWYAANHSDHEWTVRIAEGRVKVDPAASRSGRQDSRKRFDLPFHLEPAPVGKPPKVVPGKGNTSLYPMVKVADGYLYWRNAGEWGGDIWWFAPDGSKQYKVSEHQPVQFFETKHGLLAVEGLAHLSISEGSVIRLHRTPEGRWTADKLADLGAAPQAGEISGGALLVITSNGLVRVALPDGKVTPLLKSMFWSGPEHCIRTPWSPCLPGRSISGCATASRTCARSRTTPSLPIRCAG